VEEVFPSNTESSKMTWSFIFHGRKTFTLNCKALFSFTSENTLILLIGSMSWLNTPTNINDFSHLNFAC
jgi:hypothetical protein